MSPTSADFTLMKIVDRSTKKLTKFAFFLISTLKFGLSAPPRLVLAHLWSIHMVMTPKHHIPQVLNWTHQVG